MSFRSTTLQLAQNHCPRAIDHFESGMTYDRSIFSTGTAAHAFLEAAAKGMTEFAMDDCERRLLTVGRYFEAELEPPLPPEAVKAGRALADQWLETNPIPDGAIAEQTIAVDRDWNIVTAESERAYYKAALDLRYPLTVEDEEQSYTVAVARDYKSAWNAGEATLDSVQLKGQAVLLSLLYPDASVIRIEVANLRTGALHHQDIAMDDEGKALLKSWRDLIDAYIKQVDVKSMHGRPARAGTGCMGCPYVTRCSAARSILRDGVLDIPEGSDPRYAVAIRLSVVEAMRDELLRTAKTMASEAPIPIEHGYVGYKVGSKRVTADAAPGRLASLWLEGNELAPQVMDTVAGLISALKPGVSSIDSFIQRLIPSVRGDASYKERREALTSELTSTKATTEFGVHHE